MQYLLAIDDTDQENWPGTGHLLEKIREQIQHNQWGMTYSITRHQLFFHPSIPYTSHNSVMCFSGEAMDTMMIKIKALAIDILLRNKAPASDPGLCLAFPEKLNHQQKLIAFGQRAKREKIKKIEAYSLAQQLGIDLSEHGGTGDGIIGALAGIGLRLYGNDGRFRGHQFFAEELQSYQVGYLRQHFNIDQIWTQKGVPLADNNIIFLLGKIKTIFKNHQSVLPVKQVLINKKPAWQNLAHQEIKGY